MLLLFYKKYGKRKYFMSSFLHTSFYFIFFIFVLNYTSFFFLHFYLFYSF